MIGRTNVSSETSLRWIADALATPVSRPEVVRIRKPRWTPNIVEIQRPDTERNFEQLLEDEQ